MKTLRQVRTYATVISLLTLGTACAPNAGAAGPDAGDPYGDDEVVLRVDRTGGLTTFAALATGFPALVVYGDGRVITKGPERTSYPWPALPDPRVQRISPSDVETLVDLALDAGVGAVVDVGVHPADGLSTQVTVLTETGYQRSTVHAFAGSEDDRAAREALRKLLADLTDLPETLGADAVSQDGRYQPTALAAVAEPWATSTYQYVESREVIWPGPELPGDTLDADVDLHCVTISGAEATEVLAAAAEALQSTPWVAGGGRWAVSLRPLLPHEASCTDLQHREVSQHEW